MRTKATAIVTVITMSAVIAGCSTSAGKSSSAEVFSQSDIARLVDRLPEVSAKTPDLSRLKEGLPAPTNKWFSGLVFGPTSQPVFPLPIAFQLTGDGFSFGVPVVTSSPGGVSAPFAPQVSIAAGATSAKVTRYDDVSVTTTLYSGETALGDVTIARGSPVVSYEAASDTTLTSTVPFTDGTATVGTQAFGMHGDLTLNAGDSATWWAIPASGDSSALRDLASKPLRSVDTAWKGETTTLTYTVAGGGDTVIGTLRDRDSGLTTPASCDLGSFPTIDGELSLCAGDTLSWSVPTIEPNDALDLGDLTSEEKTELSDSLATDLNNSAPIPADSYFGGKALARLANLLQVARATGDEEAATTARELLSTELLRWTTGSECTERCLVYDPIIRGVVAMPASFGSEEFNDHHFHFGYFLYAAAIAASDDPALKEKLEPLMTLMAADIASSASTKYFPAHRVFDPWSGHSWASGYAPFADGNNQESSSEAVSAWNGLALWADVTDNPALSAEARWMLSAEADTAQRQWLNFDTAAEPWASYSGSVVGIVWDGKKDAGTWFSADPAAALGIQLLPMQPVADYLAGDPDRIRANLAGNSGVLFADYRLMYAALAGDDVIAQARELPEAAIDDGNSRSYLLAWVMAHSG